MTRTERLHGRFFGRKAPGEVRSRVSPASTIGNFTGRKHTLQESIAIPFEDFGEAGNVGGVEPDAEDVHDSATA